jgi:hypothetical protein
LLAGGNFVPSRGHSTEIYESGDAAKIAAEQHIDKFDEMTVMMFYICCRAKEKRK